MATTAPDYVNAAKDVNSLTLKVLMGQIDAALVSFCPPEAVGNWTVSEAREYVAVQVREDAVKAGVLVLN